MTSTRKIFTTRSSSWTTHYSFPSVPRTGIRGVQFAWSDGVWRCVGSDCFWAMSGSFKLQVDPIVAVKKSAKGEVTAFSKAGKSFPIKQTADWREVVFENDVYVVVSTPSVYEVWIDVKKFNVLGFFGWCDEKQKIILCAVEDGMKYEAHMISYKDEIGLEESERSMPEYSPSFEGHRGNPTRAMISDSEERVRSLKEEMDYYAVVKEYSPDHAHEKNEQNVQELEKLTSPVYQEKVPVVVLTNGQFNKVMRRKSSVSQIVPVINDQKKVKTIDPFQELREKLGMKPGDFLALGTPAEQPKKENVLPFALPNSLAKQVTGKKKASNQRIGSLVDDDLL